MSPESEYTLRFNRFLPRVGGWGLIDWSEETRRDYWPPPGVSWLGGWDEEH